MNRKKVRLLTMVLLAAVLVCACGGGNGSGSLGSAAYEEQEKRISELEALIAELEKQQAAGSTEAANAGAPQAAESTEAADASTPQAAESVEAADTSAPQAAENTEAADASTPQTAESTEAADTGSSWEEETARDRADEILVGNWDMKGDRYIELYPDHSGRTNMDSKDTSEYISFLWRADDQKIYIFNTSDGLDKVVTYKTAMNGALYSIRGNTVRKVPFPEPEPETEDLLMAHMLTKDRWYLNGDENCSYIFLKDGEGEFYEERLSFYIDWEIAEGILSVNGPGGFSEPWKYDEDSGRLALGDTGAFLTRQIIAPADLLAEQGLGDLYVRFNPKEIMATRYDNNFETWCVSDGNEYCCLDYHGKFWIKAYDPNAEEEVLVQTDLDQNVYQVCRYAGADAMISDEDGNDVLAMAIYGQNARNGGLGVVSDFNRRYGDSRICEGDEFIIEAYFAENQWWFLTGEITEDYNSYGARLKVRDLNGKVYWEKNVDDWKNQMDLRGEIDIRKVSDVEVIDRDHLYNVILISMGSLDVVLDVTHGLDYAAGKIQGLWVDEKYLFCRLGDSSNNLDDALFERGTKVNFLSGRDTRELIGYIGEGILWNKNDTFTDISGKQLFTLDNVVKLSAFCGDKAAVTVKNSVGNMYWGFIDANGKFVSTPVKGAFYARYFRMGRFCNGVHLTFDGAYSDFVLMDDEGNYIRPGKKGRTFLRDGDDYYYLYIEHGKIVAEGPVPIYR